MKSKQRAVNIVAYGILPVFILISYYFDEPENNKITEYEAPIPEKRCDEGTEYIGHEIEKCLADAEDMAKRGEPRMIHALEMAAIKATRYGIDVSERVERIKYMGIPRIVMQYIAIAICSAEAGDRKKTETSLENACCLCAEIGLDFGIMEEIILTILNNSMEKHDDQYDFVVPGFILV